MGGRRERSVPQDLDFVEQVDPTAPRVLSSVVQLLTERLSQLVSCLSLMCQNIRDTPSGNWLDFDFVQFLAKYMALPLPFASEEALPIYCDHAQSESGGYWTGTRGILVSYANVHRRHVC